MLRSNDYIGLNVWGIGLDRQGHAIEALSNSTKELERAAEDKPDPADPFLSVNGPSVSTRQKLVPEEVWEDLLVDNLAKKAALMALPSPQGHTVTVLVTPQVSTAYSVAPIRAGRKVARHERTPNVSQRAAWDAVLGAKSRSVSTHLTA